jgi:hypothetical protein
MKKLLSIFILTMLLFLVGCNLNQTTEPTTAAPTTVTTTTEVTTNAPTTTEVTTVTTEETTVLMLPDLDFDEYDGEGTLTDPYRIDVMMNEPFSKLINIYPINYLTYDEGVIVGDEFYPINEEVYLGLDLSESTTFTLSINPLKVGIFYVRISSLNTLPVYLRINVEEYRIDFEKNLKVLAIGNSFSVDAMEYLYKIADDYGIENIILGIMYIPGASLSKHCDSIANDLYDYVYYKNTDDAWVYANSHARLIDGLTDENWDVITIQQVSGLSGVESSYNTDIDYILSYVNEYKTNDYAKILWHMTWAYQTGSTHPDFVRYSNNQLTMYNAIISAVQSKILTRDDIEDVIPSGTAIQNLRTSFIGDTLTRDGYHLSYDLGRYTAGLTWFLKITHFSIDDITYKPDGVTDAEFLAIKEAVINGVFHPYEITNSSYEVE